MLPQVTASNSPEYRHRLAEISSRAVLFDPFNILLEQDKTGSSTPTTVEGIYKGSMIRIERKVGLGSIILEADNFAAVACWEPPSAIGPDYPETQLDEMAKERPIYSKFIRDYQAVILGCFGEGQKYWSLSLLARDPDRVSKGAIRAVLEPYIERAKSERLPIWLIAGNEHARDVYAHFGFRVLKVLFSGPESKSVLTWCMVCNWPPE